MNQIVLQASDLDGYLSEDDKNTIAVMDDKFAEAMELFPKLGPKFIIDAEQKNLLPLLNIGKESGLTK